MELKRCVCLIKWNGAYGFQLTFECMACVCTANWLLNSRPALVPIIPFLPLLLVTLPQPLLNRTLQQQHQPQPPQLIFQPWRRLNNSINRSAVTPSRHQQQEGNSAKRIEAQTLEMKLINRDTSFTTPALWIHVSSPEPRRTVSYATSVQSAMPLATTSATSPCHRLLPCQLPHNLRVQHQLYI